MAAAKAGILPWLIPSSSATSSPLFSAAVKLPGVWRVKGRKAEKDVSVSVAFNPSGNFDISAFDSHDGTYLLTLFFFFKFCQNNTIIYNKLVQTRIRIKV